MSGHLLPITYLGDIAWFRILLNASPVVIEKHENFPKQTFRNRTYIAGPNGKQMLVVPVMRGKSGHTCVRDVQIDYSAPWQKIHWRSLEAGYRRSPYFEYFEDMLVPVYEKEEKFLFDFNLKALEAICRCLRIEPNLEFTGSYTKEFAGNDYRQGWPAMNAEQQYPQVFAERNGFIPGLSAADLIFNLGPAAQEMLTQTL